MTEFKYGTGSKAYLSAIYDYGAKKVVAYHLSNRNNNTLVRDTVAQIRDVIMPAVTLIHSDRIRRSQRAISSDIIEPPKSDLAEPVKSA